MNDDVLTPKQRAVMERVIAEEEQRRSHLVIALSGSHAYGFPSPDSDLDLKSIHIEPTARVLGLEAGAPHADRMEVVDGIEIDYTSNELKPVLLGVLQGNGNYIERILGALLPHAAPELAELKPLVQRSLSRRLFRHYLGFGTSQLKAFHAERAGSAKKLLYVLRTALTGAHALRTGEVVIDLRELIDEHGFSDARALIDEKRAGERTVLPAEVGERWSAEVKRAFEVLESAYRASPLPEEPQGAADLQAWLLEQRRKRF
jgi:predicted nucleotidyltransferase